MSNKDQQDRHPAETVEFWDASLRNTVGHEDS
jgi:hypothetical protein